MKTRTFRSLLRRTLLIPLVLLVLVAGSLVVELLTLTSDLHWLDHTHQVIDTSRSAMRYMQEMESSVRAYDLTGDPAFVKEFENAEAQLPGRINYLVQLTADNQLQQKRLKEISGLDNAWRKWAEQEVAERAKHPPTEHELLLGSRLMDEIWARQREVVAEEQRLLAERTRTTRRLGTVVVATAISLSVLVVVLLLTLTRSELHHLEGSYEQHVEGEAERTRQLQESREFSRITLNSLAEGVIATDADGNVTFINPVAQNLIGWEDPAEVHGLPLREAIRLIYESSREPVRSPVEELLSLENSVAAFNQFAMLNRKGHEFPVEVNAAPIRNDRGELAGTVFVFRDITQRRQTEQALRASERLTQAGRLSATIAHEIRNPLDTVTNLIYLLQNDKNPAGVSRQYLQMASEELARITHITGQLLTFHREARNPVEVSVAEVLESVLTLFAPQIRKCGIVVERRFTTSAKVRGFPGELRQVFSNLVANSMDAMPNGGRLILSVRTASSSEDSRRKGVRATIIDSGSGIPLGVKRNLFAPFYTTKGERGTGLGLWVSRGIVEKHEGTIRVVSSVREGRSGTAFSVFLPFEQVEGKLDSARVAPAVHS